VTVAMRVTFLSLRVDARELAVSARERVLRLNPDNTLGGSLGTGVAEPGADDEDASDLLRCQIEAEAVLGIARW
jgi:hypothetical protein